MSYNRGGAVEVRIPAAIRKPKVDFSKPSALFAIAAGPNADKFFLHKEIVCFYSPVIDKMISEGCNDIQFEDVQKSTFGSLMHWMYTQDVVVEQSDTTTKSKSIVDTHLLPLSELWSLASSLDIPTLQNIVMNKIVAILDFSNMVDVVAYIMFVYEDDTTINTSIRHLVIHHAAQSLTPELLESLRHTAPREFLFDMSMAFVQHSDFAHNSIRYNFTDPNKFHVGIPELDEEMLDDELNQLDCEDPEDEKDDASALQEYFRDDATLVAEEGLNATGVCGDDFHEEDGAGVDNEEVMVEEEVGLGGLFD